MEGFDTILADGTIDEKCVLNAVINGTSENHLEMLELEAIEQLFEFKWASFARKKFYQNLVISVIHLIFLSIAVYTRAVDNPLLAQVPTSSATTVVN
jgi:hypothetical protein